MGFNPQAMLAQQNSSMEALERRRDQQRVRDRNAAMNTVRIVDLCGSLPFKKENSPSL
jgi:hypothetical protein